MPAKLWK